MAGVANGYSLVDPSEILRFSRLMEACTAEQVGSALSAARERSLLPQGALPPPWRAGLVHATPGDQDRSHAKGHRMAATSSAHSREPACQGYPTPGIPRPRMC